MKPGLGKHCPFVFLFVVSTACAFLQTSKAFQTTLPPSSPSLRSINNRLSSSSLSCANKNADSGVKKFCTNTSISNDNNRKPSVVLKQWLAGILVSLTMQLPTPAMAAEDTQNNRALVEYAMTTIQTTFYDRNGGAGNFEPHAFQHTWRSWLSSPEHLESKENVNNFLQQVVDSLGDPYSHFMTKQDLREELSKRNDGFLGVGAMVESPGRSFFGSLTAPVLANIPPDIIGTTKKPYYSAQQVSKLPVITAVVPHSPAEQAGLVVGDRIVAVGKDDFLPLSDNAIEERLEKRYHAENYLGYADLVVAKPVYATATESDWNVVVAYRPTRVRLPSAVLQQENSFLRGDSSIVAGGNSIVHYRMLTSQDVASSFSRTSDTNRKVGYVRLTRFSKASTTGYIKAIEALEKEGATAYIVDLRNNYGGVIQEALLTASSLVRDPHAVLCYTMNSRGGFIPHDVQEFVLEQRYPGLLLSKEPSTVTADQVRRELGVTKMAQSSSIPPASGYASLHEQSIQRGIHRVGLSSHSEIGIAQRKQLQAQKKIVLLVNEGTASSAEVFTAALHDNGRTVAVVGTKTYGKG